MPDLDSLYAPSGRASFKQKVKLPPAFQSKQVCPFLSTVLTVVNKTWDFSKYQIEILVNLSLTFNK